ncbi:AAA family ATPase [Marinomonas primoryensis]|uniref:AAAA superfamily protein n=1 Tax=Marinomonas primoryensis TaxID=178399 RepID=A0A859CW99_9GAMM|nr:AAA family ATPase [Marinomonas primoryensis]QKK80955.1 AAAA superfamily protein [Marinomonas primoryensis]
MPTVPYKNEIPKKYNPQNTSTAVLKKTFAIRLKEFKRLWKEISQSDMASPEQHYIIQGVRGAGKTTLLTRLCIEVEESEALSAWLIPIQLKEEEYGISSLFSFWLRIAEDLEEHPLYGTNFKGLAETIEDIEPEDGEDAKAAFKLLNNALNKHQQKIIIFIDNIAELFDHFSKLDLAILREVLSQNANLRIIGGSAVSLENFYDHKHPFYQFFNVITLGKLTKDETLDLLLALAEAAGEGTVQQIKLAIEQQPEKIESIRRLTGGVPRTMALLFDILAEGPHGTTFGYLDDTLDMASPIYKHRMDDLSKQQKPIVHAIAKHWDAISVKEIAQKTRIDSKTISAQLSQLQKQWIVEKIPTDNKNHLYRIQERFFNIWYLMRYGRRRDKNKLLWLTRFIEMWCTQEDLTHRVTQFSSGLSNDAYLPGTLAYTSALLGCKNISVNEKEQIYQHAHAFFKQQNDASYLRSLPEIEGDEYADQAFTCMGKNDFEQALKHFEKAVEKGLVRNHFMIGCLYHFVLNDFQLAEKNYLKAIEHGFGFVYTPIAKLYFDYMFMEKNGQALIYAQQGVDNEENFHSLHTLSTIALWNNELKIAANSMEKTFIRDTWPQDLEEHAQAIIGLLMLFLAKKQTHLVNKWFKEYNLIEKFKPIHYVLMLLMKDEYPNEYLRMGSELEETVTEILEKVDQLAIIYQ